MNAQLIDLFYQCEDYFFKAISRESFILENETAVYITGVPVASLNLVVMHKDINNLKDFLCECDQFFCAKNLPWAAVLSEHYLEHELEESLARLYFEDAENATPMVIAINKKPQFEPQVDRLVKSTDTNLKAWMLPLIEAFHSTEELTALYLQTHEHALSKPSQLRHLTLFIDDDPISSLTLSFTNNVARIDDFGTVPSYQGKGYGRYLLSYALEEVKKLGVELCFLEAAETSLSLYKKMGFTSLFRRKYLWNFLR
ncbi:GNAT family N-acetyltransferase [Legionella lansingensis]|nr:GNAT family N-acetyltransferase [Legionella lansingensis]